MKALVTGTSGFVGSHLKAYLAASGVEVIDPMSGGGDWDAALSCDVIFSIASGADVARSLEEPGDFVNSNVALAIDLGDFARRMPRLRHFIHLSTGEVYGPAPGDLPEWSPIAPQSPYAASKAAQEAVLISYWKSYGVPVTIVNTANVFGERQPGKKFIPIAVQQILKRAPFTVHPTSRRWIHADALSDALLWISLNPRGADSQTQPARYHVVGEEEILMRTLAKRIADILGVEERYWVEGKPERPGHEGRYSLDGGKIHRAGWRLPQSFQDYLEQTVKALSATP